MSTSSKQMAGWDQLWKQVLNLLRSILQWIQSFMQKAGSGPAITMDTGRRVRMGKQIAEGGFSYIFEATDDLSSVESRGRTVPKLYALKQIRCPEPEMLQECRQEAAVHRAAMNHPNILPLLGFTVMDQVCYMLFPRMNRSLRHEINYRILDAPGDVYSISRPPWNEVDALNLFLGIARAVQAIHHVHYSHRDVKVENVMFEHPNSTRTPVLMDFGSVGPLREEISTRRQVLNLTERAAQHTTISYRPPELFEGGVRAGDPSVDFTKVDVWSLGCTLFAQLFGSSPFESEFTKPTGRLRIVDCTQLKVLGDVPKPTAGCPAASWYSNDTLQLIEKMLMQDRQKRLSVAEVILEVVAIIEKLGGRVMELERTSEVPADEEDEGDLDSLLSSNRGFV